MEDATASRPSGPYVPCPWPFLVSWLIPVTVVVGSLVGALWSTLTVLVVFGILPALDLVMGQDTRNPDERTVEALTERKAFRYITWAWVPLQVALLVFALLRARHSLPAEEWLGLAVSTGVTTGGVGIVVAHELGHRRGAFERFLSEALLVMVGYGHWRIEHVYGHHANVATPQDPATARLGQSFYGFWPQTVGGTFRHAWAIETVRLTRSGSPNAPWRNRVLHLLAIEVALALVILVLLGASAFALFLAQAFVAISLLEAVNYIEHYGLARKVRPDGRYERVTPVHSWNCSERLTNWFLINLQRHSDHHAAPTRRYQALRHFGVSPQLPTGYAGMVLLALAPPIWFRVMDPLVAETRAALPAGLDLPGVDGQEAR